MKKTLIVLTFLAGLILAACSSSTTSNSSQIAGPGTGPLSSPLDLLVGTFELEDTDNAVTAGQAAELIPLWQAYGSLSTSDTAAQQEIDALMQQIRDTMSPDQVKAIQDMKLTVQDMFALMQDQGLSSGFGDQGNPDSTPQPGSFPGGGGEFPGGGGGFPAGGGTGGPGGGGGFPGSGGFPGGAGSGQGDGQNLTPQQQATLEAFRAERPNGGGLNRVPPALIEALIKLLQSK